jgi:hypothetical protein
MSINIEIEPQMLNSMVTYQESALPVIYLKRVRRVFAHLGPGNIRNPMALLLKCRVSFKVTQKSLKLAGHAIRHPELPLSKVILWKPVH